MLQMAARPLLHALTQQRTCDAGLHTLRAPARLNTQHCVEPLMGTTGLPLSQCMVLGLAPPCRRAASGVSCRGSGDAQTPSSTASAQSWCAGAPVPRSRYVDPPTPLREPKEEQPPQSPGALNGFRKGIMKTLQTAPQYIMAGAVVAAAAAGFLKVSRELSAALCVI